MKKIILLLFTLFFCEYEYSYAAVDKDSKIKAAWIFKFAHTIEWKNPKELVDFRIGILGANENVINELKRITNRKKEGKFFIKVVVFNSIAEVSQTEILFVDYAKFRNFSTSNLKGNTLLISDNNLDMSRTMLAFIEGNKKLNFAFNKENIVNGGLKLTGAFVGLTKKTVRITDDNLDDDMESDFIEPEVTQELSENQTSTLTTPASSSTESSSKTTDRKKSSKSKSITDVQESPEYIQKQAAIQKQEKEIASKMNDVVSKKEQLDLQLKSETLTQDEKLKLQEDKIDLVKQEYGLRENVVLAKKQEYENLQDELVKLNAKYLTVIKALNLQKVLNILIVAMIGFVIVALFIVYRNYRSKLAANVLLETQKVEISAQKRIIEEKNHEVMDSINYSKRIQSAILPNVNEIEKNLSDFFILYKPKDIVSGDFYYYNKLNDQIYIAAADCTGHGVPGAFMSLVGFKEAKIANALYDSPGKILKALNNGVKETLKQTSEEATGDGIDIGLLRLNDTHLSYAGANRPLWIIKKNSFSIIEVKATKSAIAGYTKNDQEFEEHTIDLEKGDCVYLFSDGYADQFGGDKNKKLTTKRFKDYLITIKNQAMKEQKKQLEGFVEKWRGPNEQVDDILVIGIRI
jgi:serine phosphatase RsbU (regulator of sigma subunit)